MKAIIRGGYLWGVLIASPFTFLVLGFWWGLVAIVVTILVIILIERLLKAWQDFDVS
jgi:hypothetical protein